MIPTTKDAYKLLHDGSLALSQVEAAGIKIDVEYLNTKIKETEEKIKELETSIRKDPVYITWRKHYGGGVNLDSGPQLGKILFEVMKFPVVELTPTKRPSTDETAIGRVGIPFTRDLLRLRKFKKLRGTFLEGVRRETVDGYFHPIFNLHLASTYRSSSGSDKSEDKVGRDLNFQNLPIRNQEIASILRRCFIARKGRRIVEIDYSGIEVKVAACYNKDPVLIKYIEDKTTDMHRDQAGELFCMSPEFLLKNKEWAKKTVRDWSKNRFVFPEFYGSVYFQCAPHIWEAITQIDEEGNYLHKIPGTETYLVDYLKKKGIKEKGECDPKKSPEPGTFENHVKKVEDSFWKKFSVYANWKKSYYEKYLKNGEFTSYTGFTMKWGKSGLLKRNDVVNYPIQGSAFHCLLWSLTRIQKYLNKYKFKTKIIGQIHDSILLDVLESEFHDVIQVCKKIMTVDLVKMWSWIVVPMEVEVEASPIEGSWYDKKKVEVE